MTRKRMAWTAAGVAAGCLVTACVAGIMVLRSAWFYEKVRERAVAALETATGGRVEIGSFQFEWRKMRAEFRGVTLHGAEPADKPPLFHAASIAAGLKIVSILERKIDIRYLEAVEPRVSLILYPDGHTNVPEPKVKTAGRPAMDTILDLAVGSFHLQNGVFEVLGRGQTPFDVRGRNLDARFLYDRAGPRYRGDISIQPLEVEVPGVTPMGWGITTAMTIEKNRIGLTTVKLTTGDSTVDISGAVENLNAPHGRFQYAATVSVTDAGRILRSRLLDRGTVQVAGNAVWGGSRDVSITGSVHAHGVDLRVDPSRLRGFRLDGALTGGPEGLDLKGVRLSGDFVQRGMGPVPLGGTIGDVSLRGPELAFHDVAVSGLGGSFHGEGQIRNLRAFHVGGEISGVETRPAAALFLDDPLPWSGIASGPVTVDGMLKGDSLVKATASVTIVPAPNEAPVHGEITANYDDATGILDVGHSTITLPSSRAEATGAIGRLLRLHVETRDLGDLLPILGESAASVPVKFEKGSAIFDGTVAGKLNHPRIAGHVTATGFSYAGQSLDTLEADVDASPDGVRVEKAALGRGALRAEFQGSVGLREWKTEDRSAIAGSGTLRKAPLAELAAMSGAAATPVSGTLDGSVEVAGTAGDPRIKADLDVSKGAWRDEPFDRFTAHVNFNSRSVEMVSAKLTAGAKEVNASATFEHAPNLFDAGRVRFQVTTNAMPLDEIHTLADERPGLKGRAEVSGKGEVEVTRARGGAFSVRILDVHADVWARGLQLTRQALGDVHVWADSQNGSVRAHLESSAAGSTVRGDGQWRLDGDNQGSAEITFSKLDFGQLRDLLSPSDTGAPAAFSGSAEGQLHIDGPALKPLKAELRIPKLELGPATDAKRSPEATAALSLHNSGPLVAVLANHVITVESAHLVGRSTDFSISGRVQLQQRSPLELRMNGKVDLALLQDLNRDLVSSGTVAVTATVRGALDAPQINGRVEFQDAAFNVEGFPNGISKATGAIAFSGERATIQNFTGETGGGQIQLTGFAGYGGDSPMFRVHARIREVRVRYPEGVSTVSNASLNFTGTADRSMLSGTVTILRAGFNPQSDFSSVLATSAQPVRTPAARTGVIGGLNFDIQIDTAPDIRVQSALTQDIEVEANLKLRGTVSNPGVLGRINITHGQVAFFGTKYTVSQGSVAFYNPVRLDPILDVDLETKARGIDITLNVSGPLDKLNLTPRSDPPLQFQEIVALLATGRTPTSDPSLLTQQSSSPQSWQQMGASALLGSAIASPVAGRLQRFFGVSQLRIDPTLPGVENNPQARLTLEQQVTPEITFTYITNVTTSNPQVVRMEWSFAKQWSVVALREENGLFGLDFFFKKRF